MCAAHNTSHYPPNILRRRFMILAPRVPVSVSGGLGGAGARGG